MAKDAGVVARMEVRQAVARRQVFWLYAALAVLVGFGMVMVGQQLKRNVTEGLARLVVESLFTHQSLPVAIIVYFVLMPAVLQKERHTRTLESLLAAPLDPRAVWLGKAVACWAIGWIGAVVSCVSGWAAFCASVGAVVAPGVVAMAFFVGVGPVTALGIYLLLALANLVAKRPVVANVCFFYVGIGYFWVSMYRAKSMVVTWEGLGVFAVLTVGTLGLAAVLGRRLSAEDMILADYKVGGGS